MLRSARVFCGYERLVVFGILALCNSATVKHETDEAQYTVELHMPDVHPDTEDEYWCTSAQVPTGTNYIVQFEALASMDTAHHMLLFGCEEPAHKIAKWKGGTQCKLGTEPSKIMFAWGRNAPATHLPPDVGFEIGGDSKVKYFVLQIHYKSAFTAEQSADSSGVRMTFTAEQQRYQAGVMLMMAMRLNIPAHAPKVHGDVSCKYKGHTDLHPFAFRVHAHDLGTVITGYTFNKTWNLMGRGNPQWPQAFYPMEQSIAIKPNDYLAARCTYDASDRNRDTRIGSTHNDEMCNFYFMYYTEYGQGKSYLQCAGNSYKTKLPPLPADSDVPPPPNPALDHIHHQSNGDTEEEMTPSLTELQFVPKWHEHIDLGQVAGVATDSKGNVHVFHRGSRAWDQYSFDVENNFIPKEAIAEDVLVTFDQSGKVIKKWGSNMFYMPHGLFIGKDDNVWVTDVGLHQVFRFPPDSDTADIELGVARKHGSADDLFCKPTDVTVIGTGEVFITDGYCNSRVKKYSKDGQFLNSFGAQSSSKTDDGYPQEGTFSVPHSITNVPTHDMVCVADRENRRIQCFDYQGNFQKQLHPKEITEPVYAVDYCPDYDVLLAITGPDVYKKGSAGGFTIDFTSNNVIQRWGSPDNEFKMPHDVTVSHMGTNVYVADIKSKEVFMFTRNETNKPASHLGHPSSVDNSVDESTENKIESGASAADFGASIVIGALLVIPVLVIIIIVVFLRVRKQLKLKLQSLTGEWDYKRSRRRFNLGAILGGGRSADSSKWMRRGRFQRVSTQDDGELAHLRSDDDEEDSEVDEFTVSNRA